MSSDQKIFFKQFFKIMYNLHLHFNPPISFPEILSFSRLIFEKVKNSVNENANKYNMRGIIRILSDKGKFCHVFKQAGW